MAWQDILNEFKTQFQTVGPEKYSGIDNPEMRYQLANERAAGAMQGANQASSVIAKNVATAQAAAEKAKSAESYTRQRNKSGGYTFYDGSGKEISAWDFSLAKDVSIADVLAGSMDPGDKMFLEDLSAMDQDLKTVNPKTGKPIIDYQTALDKISNDYSNIFFGKGANTGGSGIKDYSKKARVGSLEGQYGTETTPEVGFLKGMFTKRSTGENVKIKANNLVTNFLTQVKNAPTEEQALAEYSRLINSGELDKFAGDKTGYSDEDIKKTLQQIIKDLYPGQEQYNPLL